MPNPHTLYSYLGYLKTQWRDALWMSLATAILAIPMEPSLMVIPVGFWAVFLVAVHHEWYWHNYAASRSIARSNQG